MVTYDRNQEREFAQQSRLRICVAGIGGAGLNVLDRISLDRMMDSSLVSMHTDVRVLSQAMASVKIQLGADIMRGIGSGGDPELGREAASSSREHIKAALQGHDMVFLCVGLGGGTGSGAAPVVAEIAKEVGAMVFVFATMPFPFEGRRRLRQAEVSLEELQNHVDGLILFENSRMGELILPKEGIQKAFSQADQLIGQSVRAVSSMVSQHGIVRISMADLATALRSLNSRCLFGFGEAKGANRVTEALKRALKSPLVNQGLLLQNASNLLVHVAGGEGLALSEVETLMKNLGKHVPDTTQILFGLTVDAKLGDTLAVTLLSSLSAQEMALESAASTFDHLAATVATKAPAEELKAAPRATVVSQPPLNGNGVAKVPAVKPVIAPPAKVEAETIEMPITDLFAPVMPAFMKAPEAAPVAAPVELPVANEIVQPEPIVTHPEEVEPVVHAEIAPEPAPIPQPVAPAPVQEVVLPEPQPIEPVVAEVRPQSIFIEEEALEEEAEPEPEPEPVVQRTVQTPAPTSSVFAVIEDDDDLEEEEAEAFIPAPQPVAPAPAPRRSLMSAIIGGSKPEPAAAPAPVHQERRPVREEAQAPEPAAQESHVFDTVKAQIRSKEAQAKIDYQQASFNLTPEEVSRFKGTEKIFHEGDDLDVPTWMRAKHKLKS